ncbi:MAG: hypothetical protein PHN55_15620 [Dysgonamonadaceae bacterium]|nr:hypothetical protein [Dysgonamonadaceae bacterium]
MNFQNTVTFEICDGKIVAKKGKALNDNSTGHCTVDRLRGAVKP